MYHNSYGIYGEIESAKCFDCADKSGMPHRNFDYVVIDDFCLKIFGIIDVPMYLYMGVILKT